MVNIKRYICFTLMAVMIFTSVVPLSSLASDEKILFSEGFDTLPTSSPSPSSVQVTGGSENRVIETGKNTKALKLGLAKTSGSLSFPVYQSGQVWFGARFRINGKIDNGAFFQVISSSGTKLNLINLSGYAASFYDGKYFTLLKKDIWTNVQILLDTDKKNYSVWVDGKQVLSKWKITTAIPELSKVGFEFSNPSSDASVEFDHLVAYTGSQVMKNFPKEEFNPEVSEVKAEDSTKAIPKLYIHEDFNTFGRVNATYTTTVPLGNPIEVRNQQGHSEYHEGDRMYLYMANENGKGPYYDLVMKKFNSSSYVVDMVLNIFKLNVCGVRIQLRAGYSGTGYNLVLAETNGVLRCGSDVLNNLDFNRWTRLSFIIDHSTTSFDVCIDGVVVREGVPFSSVPQGVDRVRIALEGSGFGEIGLDAVAVYEGRELKPSLDQEDYMENVVNGFIDDDNTVNSFIGNKAVFCVTNSAFLKDGVRTNYDKKGYTTSDGVVMSPVDAMAKAYGISSSFDSVSQNVTLSNGAVFTVGSDCALFNGQSIYLGAETTVKEGIVFVPAIAFFEKILGKKTTYESTWELVFITEDGSVVNVTDTSMMRLVMHKMIFDRIPSDEMAKTVSEKFPSNTHPRLGITKEDIPRIKEALKTDETTQKLYDYLVMVCNDYLISAPVGYVTNKNGDVESVRTREERMENLGVLYHLTGDERYAKRAVEELEEMLKMPYLAWGNPLNSGALMAAFTRGFDLFYDYMSDDMKTQIKDRVLKMWKRELLEGSDATGSRSNQWRRTVKDNYVPVHNAPYLESTLAFVDEPDMTEYAKKLFEVTERALEYTSEGYAPDGAWDEGIGYWSYTLLEWAPAVKAMKNTLGSALGFEDHLGMDQAAFFRMDAGGIVRVNAFHDSGFGTKFSSRPSLVEQTMGMYVLADLYQNPAILKGWMRNIDNFQHSDPGYSLAWYDPRIANLDADLSLDHHYRSRLDFVALRSSWEDDNAILLSANSGLNSFGHSHIDGGTYVMDAMGLNWICDLGTESYSVAYDPLQGNYYRTRPEAHNVYLINPRAGYQGQDTGATGSTIRFDSMERGGYAVVDMSKYYAKDASTAQRGFKLSGDRSYAVVRDEIALLGQSDIISFINTQADIEIIDNNRAYFKQFGKKMLIEVSTNGRNLSLESMACDMLPTSGKNPPDAMDNSEYRKLAIRLSGSGNIYINVKLTPLYEDLTSTKADDIQLALWKNDEGEIQKPRLSEVSVNGEVLKDFNPENSLIEVKLSEKTTKVPVVKATADDRYSVEIRQNHDNLLEDGLIKLTDKANAENVSYYTIRYILTPEKVENINALKLLPIVSVVDEESNENVTSILTDRNFSTERYEGEVGCEYLIDLGSVQSIDSVITAFSLISDYHKYWYDIAYSQDGINYTYKTCQQSLGSDGYERVYLGENVNARFIRLILNGRTASNVSRLNEVAVVGK
ncbi:MAG: DUF4962 domain-containing protein [Ruminococcaceae bacterium]|nr:DUF4962 domain-containing protein [Oscillospiraceae bacterium]